MALRLWHRARQSVGGTRWDSLTGLVQRPRRIWGAGGLSGWRQGQAAGPRKRIGSAGAAAGIAGSRPLVPGRWSGRTGERASGDAGAGSAWQQPGLGVRFSGAPGGVGGPGWRGREN